MNPISAFSCTHSEKFALFLHRLTEQHTENKFILHYLDDFLFWGTKNSLFCKNTLGTFKLGIVCLILLADMLLEVHVGPFADVSLTPPLESQNTTIGL